MSKKNWANILLLGFGFFLLFTAFQTSGFVQTITIASFLSPDCNNATGSYDDGGIEISENFANKIGYISLCIIYLMVAVGNWISVSVVAVIGPKLSLLISSLLYVVYIAILIRPYVPLVFIGAAILGTGGGVLWTAQGQILIQNSSKNRMGSTSGIFWLMLESSLVVGGLVYFTIIKISGEGSNNCIKRETNYILFGVLTALGLAGVFVFMFIQPVKREADGSYEPLNSEKKDEEQEQLASSQPKKASMETIVKAIVDAFKMLLTLDMLLLSICFIYTGYVLNFWSGVFGTITGHTGNFQKFNVGLASLFIGLGEIAGGGLFGILGKYTIRWGRDPIILIGMLVHFLAFLLVFYNFPNSASLEDISFIDSFGYLFNPSIVYVGHLCAFLLGFGDSCFNTQIYSIIGGLYPTDERSAPAMALYKFFQSIAAMVGFLTSTLITVQWQLLVLTILAVAGTLCFSTVEWRNRSRPKNLEHSVQTKKSQD